jgi:hypothetical protein
MHQFDLMRSSLLLLHEHSIKQRHKQRRTFLPKSGGLSFFNSQGVGLSDARSLACMHIARSAQPLQASPASPISHIRPPFPAFVVAVRCDLYISFVLRSRSSSLVHFIHIRPSIALRGFVVHIPLLHLKLARQPKQAALNICDGHASASGTRDRRTIEQALARYIHSHHRLCPG